MAEKSMFTRHFEKNRHKAKKVGLAYVTNTRSARKRTFERTVYEYEGELIVMMNGNAYVLNRVLDAGDGHMVGWI